MPTMHHAPLKALGTPLRTRHSSYFPAQSVVPGQHITHRHTVMQFGLWGDDAQGTMEHSMHTV